MKLSILVPVYNAERFLEPFLRCLAAQELSDAEVIFVDDCSTDGSRRRLEGLGGLGGLGGLDGLGGLEVQVISLPRNVGVSEARQAALDAAKGEYVIFADPDDLVEPGMYRELVEVAEKTGADLVWEDFWEGGGESKSRVEVEEWTRRDCFVEDTTGEGLIQAILTGRLHGATWNKLIRRSFIEQCGARFLSGRVGMCEDVDFLCQVLMAEPKCVYHDGCHYRYRVVQGSATHTSREKQMVSLKIVEKHLKMVLTTKRMRAVWRLWVFGNWASSKTGLWGKFVHLLYYIWRDCGFRLAV